MGTYQYPNIIFVQENEETNLKCNILEHAIVAESPRHDQLPYITREEVYNAIEQQFGPFVDPHNVASYGSKFLIQPNTQRTRNEMLRQRYLKTSPHHLALIPWTPEHGSIKVPAHTQVVCPVHPTFNDSARAANRPKKHVQIEITGIPAHLTINETVAAVLNKYCTITNITFDPVTYTYTVYADTYCMDMIPELAHLTLHKIENNQHFLYIWPIWCQTFDCAEIYHHPSWDFIQEWQSQNQGI